MDKRGTKKLGVEFIDIFYLVSIAKINVFCRRGGSESGGDGKGQKYVKNRPKISEKV